VLWLRIFQKSPLHAAGLVGSQARCGRELGSGSLVGARTPQRGPTDDVEPDDVDQLGGKAGIARALEGAQPVRLQFVRPPDAVYRAQRDPNSF
jgi:hypothetical protein